MKDALIIGIPLLVLVVLYVLSYEKWLKTNPYFLIISIMMLIGFGGYLLGTCDEFTRSKVLLIVLFLGGGLWRLVEFGKLINRKRKED